MARLYLSNVLLLLVFSLAGCLCQDPDPEIEFSEVVFDDVTELDLFVTLVGNYTVVDPVSGLSGLLAYMWCTHAMVSRDCVVETWTLITDMLQFKEYALQMRASNANPPRLSAMAFTGNFKYLANYELCVAVTETDRVPMTAHICDMTTPLQHVEVGMCVPKSCSANDLDVIVNTVLDQYESIYSGVNFACIANAPLGLDAILFMCILFVFAVAVITGTVYDLIFSSPKQMERNNNGDQDNPADETTRKMVALDHLASPGVEPRAVEQSQATSDLNNGTLKKILMSFSLMVNGAGVLVVKKSSANLGALNGMRVLSMWWIVWCHCVFFLFDSRTVANPNELIEGVGAKPWFNITWQGHFGVDTFFVISALLVTYLTLKRLDKSNGKINWVLFYVHRYIRLTPVYMVCVGIAVTLALPIGEGSGKIELIEYHKSICLPYVWTNLLYINNLVPYPGSINLCMGWFWYLANDMQFFILTPIFILLLFRPSTRKYGLIALASVTALSCIITAAVSGYWGYQVTYVSNHVELNYNRSDRSTMYPDDRIYAKPWCRIQAYTVGIYVGYLLYMCKGKKIKIHLAWNLIGWALAIVTIYVVMFVLSATTTTTEPLPPWLAATYLGVRRFLFAAAVGWMAFACVTGNGGPIDVFLSWNVWIPLAKLNYCSYLVHPLILFNFYLTKRSMVFYTLNEHIFLFWGTLATTYIVSLFLTLLVEVPTIALEKALLPRK